MKFAFLRGLASACLVAALCLPSPLLLVAAKADTPAKTITLPPGVTRVTSVEGITEYRLENGLRVLLFPDESKQTITVNITIWSVRVMKTMAKPAWHTTRAPCLQGHAAPPGHSQRTDRTRRAPERDNLA
jgi:hypothetical protein